MPKKRSYDKKRTQTKLLCAVEAVLLEEGVQALGINSIARRAGVDKVLIYRYFGNLEELLSAYGRSVKLWPCLDELLSGEEDISPARCLSLYFRSLISALAAMPVTLEILAFSLVKDSELAHMVHDHKNRAVCELIKRIDPFLSPGVNTQTFLELLHNSVIYKLVAARDQLREQGEPYDRPLDTVYDTLDATFIRIFSS